MRRSAVLITAIIAILSLALLAGCGGKSTPKTSGPGIPSTVTLTPSTASLAQGEVLQFSASVVDVNNNPVTNQTIAFSSSNTSILQVAANGAACAGTWDSLTLPVVCTPGPIGTATVTATSGTLKSTPATVAVHARVDQVVVSPANPACISSGRTMQFTARAFSNGQDVTSTVGAFTWNTTQAQVASIDQTGTATAAAPGVAGIIASVGGATSNTVPFTSCPVLSIRFHTDKGATSFTTNTTTSQALAADVIDVNGVPVTNATAYLTYIVENPVVGSVPSSAVFGPSAPGSTPITAVCAPPNCNIGLSPVYGNALFATVTGTTATTVYAASYSQNGIVLTDNTTNATSTPTTLPHTPNSMVATKDGTRLYMGSDSGLMSYDTNANTVGTATTILGRILSASPDGQHIIMVNDTKGTLSIVGTSTGQVETHPATGVISASFSPDSSRAYLLANNSGTYTLYIWSTLAAFSTETLSAPANDSAFLTSGALGFIAGGAPLSVTARYTCDNTGRQAASVAVPAIPARIAPLPDGSGMIAVDNTGVDVFSASVATSTTPCPPIATASLTKLTSFNAGSFAPHQLIVTPNGAFAFVLADQANVLGYDIANNRTFIIPLAGGALPTTGGVTLDSRQLWVGGSDNKLHLIDVASAKDATQVSVSFTPDLVVVRPH